MDSVLAGDGFFLFVLFCLHLNLGWHFCQGTTPLKISRPPPIRILIVWKNVILHNWKSNYSHLHVASAEA